MELVIKHFNELTIDELYEILRIRAEIFVVEQDAAYQDLDCLDQHSVHLYLKDEDGIQAYLRVIEPGRKHENAMISRVVSRKRRCGLATRLLKAGIEVAQKEYGADRIKISAQVYAIPLYEGVGFRVTNDEVYLEDGLPHKEMKWFAEEQL